MEGRRVVGPVSARSLARAVRSHFLRLGPVALLVARVARHRLAAALELLREAAQRLVRSVAVSARAGELDAQAVRLAA